MVGVIYHDPLKWLDIFYMFTPYCWKWSNLTSAIFFQKMGCWNHQLGIRKYPPPIQQSSVWKTRPPTRFPRWKTTIRWVVHWGQRGILRWVRGLLAWQNLSIAAGRWEAFHVYLAPILQRRKSISWRCWKKQGEGTKEEERCWDWGLKIFGRWKGKCWECFFNVSERRVHQ